MVGRIEGTFDGRPWSCVARENRIDVEFQSIMSVLKRRNALRQLRTTLRRTPLMKLLSQSTRCTLKIGWLPRIPFALAAD